MNYAAHATSSRNQNPADYFYSAATHRSRGVLWPIFTPARIPRLTPRNAVGSYQALGMLTQLLRRGSVSYQGGFCNLVTGQLVPLSIRGCRIKT